MKILIIASHPNLKDSKVNNRWLEEAKKNKNITVHILDEVYQDKAIDVEKEKELLKSHDRIVFQFPFHWYNITAKMRIWQNEVFQYGWAYGPDGNALKDKECVLAVSIGGAEHSYQAGGYNNYSISELLKPMQQVANLTQMKYLKPFTFYKAVVATEDEINASAINYIEHITDENLNPEVSLRNMLKKMQEENKTL